MYQSPIEMFTRTVAPKINKTVDGMILNAVIDAGIHVDRDELIKALAYDRNQYEKGYADGKADTAEWISVEKYLPSMEQLVLFVDKHRRDFCVHIGKLNFIGAKNTVYFQTRGCGRYHNAIAASHWMPLPEPLKEE